MTIAAQTFEQEKQSLTIAFTRCYIGVSVACRLYRMYPVRIGTSQFVSANGRLIANIYPNHIVPAFVRVKTA